MQPLQLVACQLKLHPVVNKLCSCSHQGMTKKEALIAIHFLVIMWWLQLRSLLATGSRFSHMF